MKDTHREYLAEIEWRHYEFARRYPAGLTYSSRPSWLERHQDGIALAVVVVCAVIAMWVAA